MSQCVYQNTLLDDIVRAHPLPRQLVKRAALEVLDIIREGLLRDGSVRINNFGTFRIKRTAPRRGRNPKTGEPITIPPRNTVVFAPCKALREQLEAPPAPLTLPTEPQPSAVKTAAMAMAARPAAAVRSVPLPQGQAGTPPVAPVQTTAPAPRNSEQAAPSSPGRTEPVQEVAAATATPSLSTGEAANSPFSTESTQPQDDVADKTAEKGRHPVWFYTGSAVLAIGLLLWQQLGDEPGTDTVVPSQSTPAPLSPVLTGTQPMPRSTASAALFDKALPLERAVASPVAQPVSTDTPARAGSDDGGPFFTASTHTIASGDSLWRLAERYYGDPLLWPHIYQANAQNITNPDLLRSGRRLTIPQLQGSPADLSETDRRHIASGYFITYLYYRDHGHRDAFFALLEAKRYSAKVVEERMHELELSRLELILLAQQQPLEYP